MEEKIRYLENTLDGFINGGIMDNDPIKQINFRLPNSLQYHLKLLALYKNLTHVTLVKIWVTNCIEQERQSPEFKKWAKNHLQFMQSILLDEPNET